MLEITKSKIAHAGPKDNVKNLLGNPKLQVPNENELSKNISLEGKNRTAKKYFPPTSKETPYEQTLIDNLNKKFTLNFLLILKFSYFKCFWNKGFYIIIRMYKVETWY